MRDAAVSRHLQIFRIKSALPCSRTDTLRLVSSTKKLVFNASVLWHIGCACEECHEQKDTLASTILLLSAVQLTRAQEPEKKWRIGFLGAQSASRVKDRADALQQGLRELGYSEGKNLILEYRWANGDTEQLPTLIEDLIRSKVAVIIVSGGSSTIAAVRNATRAIPIVFAGSNDPVASGFVASLARPGGNLTGATIGGPELYGKRIEFLKEAVPGISRIALLYNPTVPSVR